VLGEDQVSEFKEAFELFDPNRSGFITKDGLRNTLKQFGRIALLFLLALFHYDFDFPP
jgi:Ca2+-binding EF-hand superfamily protein